MYHVLSIKRMVAAIRKYIVQKKGLKKVLVSSGLDGLDLSRDMSTSGRGTKLKL